MTDPYRDVNLIQTEPLNAPPRHDVPRWFLDQAVARWLEQGDDE